MFDVTALGELLIDFTSVGISENKMRIFEQNPGGAPANVVCAVSKLGLKTAFVGKVGTDMHGDFLRCVLNENKVETAGLIADPQVFTTLAFVELSKDGERSFSFARKPGADTMLRIDELNMDIIQNSYIFHIGSLSLTDEPARSATMYALQKAREANSIISYDPNYRALLWSGKDEAKTQMRSVFPLVDMIKISEEETDLLTEHKTPEKASEELLNLGIPLVIVTLGPKGALIRTREGAAVIPGGKTKVVDTTGAGDAFLGGYLYQMAATNSRPESLSLEKAGEFARFANRVADLCVGRRGAINAMPTLQEIST